MQQDNDSFALQEEAAENVAILLLGNKSDCAERQVPTQEGEILAKVQEPHQLIIS